MSLFKYGYNRSKAFILYKSCKWLIKSRRNGAPFESTSVEMNKNNMMSSIKMREKSMYLLDGDNELKEVDREEMDEMFNEVKPSCLITTKLSRQLIVRITTFLLSIQKHRNT